jgi:hypothetical protein
VHIYFTYSILKRTHGMGSKERDCFPFLCGAAHNHCCAFECKYIKSHFSLFIVRASTSFLSLSAMRAHAEKKHRAQPSAFAYISAASETMAYFIPEHAVRSPFLYANLHTVLFFYYSLSCAAASRVLSHGRPIKSPLCAAAVKKKTVSIHACIE